MTNQELAQYLSTLATVAGGGALLWLLMGLLVKAAPGLDQNREAKFWIAFTGSFIIPVGALAVKAAYLGETTTLAEWVTAVTAGFQISQGVHRGTSAVRAKVAENEEKAREEETKAMAYVGNIPQGDNPDVRVQLNKDAWLSDEWQRNNMGSGSMPSPPTLPIAPAAPRFDDTEYDGDSGDVQPFPDGERGASGGR